MHNAAQNGRQPGPGRRMCQLQDAYPAPATGHGASRSVAVVWTAHDRRHPDGRSGAFDEMELESVGGHLFREQSLTVAWVNAHRSWIVQRGRRPGQYQHGPATGTRGTGMPALAHTCPGAGIASFWPRPVAILPLPDGRSIVPLCAALWLLAGGTRLVQHADHVNATKMPPGMLVAQDGHAGGRPGRGRPSLQGPPRYRFSMCRTGTSPNCRRS